MAVAQIGPPESLAATRERSREITDPRLRMIAETDSRYFDLIERVRAVKDDPSLPSFCANEVWVRIIKPGLYPIAGWGAENKALASSADWDAAGDYLYQLLPDCRKCGCL